MSTHTEQATKQNFHYRCSVCDGQYPITPELMLCPNCSVIPQSADQPPRGILDVVIDKKIKSSANIFDFLPVEQEFFLPMPVGNTPLWRPPLLKQHLEFKNLFIKDDSLNPTGSFKDRASFLVSAFANKHKINEITLASTGNAGSSMSGVGAAAGQKITLFLPKSAPPAKIVQSIKYGANVITVDGNYDFAFDISLEYSKRKKILSRNTAYNPLTIEGKKTVSLEIFNQLDSNVPDHVFVPTGDGVIITGVYKGFADLIALGLSKKMPTIHCVQATGSDAINRAWASGHFSKISANTIADSISVDIPRNGWRTLKYLKEFKGQTVTVSDEEILQAQSYLAQNSGIFAEPAAATSFAGFLRVKDSISKNDSVIILITGNGLQDIKSAMINVKMPDKHIKSIDELLSKTH